MSNAATPASRAIVFDFDGTLVDSTDSVLHTFRHAVEPWGVRLMPADLDKLRARGRHDLFTELVGESAAPEALSRLLECALANAADTKPYAGIGQMLEDLRSQGARLAVWTARDGASTEEILKHHGIRRYFESVVGNCGVVRNKPAPDGLIRIAGELGIDPAQILHVGDHEHDVQGARSAGCRAGGAVWRNGSTRDWGHQPDHWFASPSDIVMLATV